MFDVRVVVVAAHRLLRRRHRNGEMNRRPSSRRPVAAAAAAGGSGMSPEKKVCSDFSHVAGSTLEPDSKAFLQTDTIFKSINGVIKCLWERFWTAQTLLFLIGY